MNGPLTVHEYADLANATLPKITKDKLAMTFSKVSNELANVLFEKASRDGYGKYLTWPVTLKDTGNAKMTGLFDKDTKNVVPTDTEGSTRFVMATTNVSYDIRSEAFNSPDEVRIYNELESKIDNMYREFGDLLNSRLLLTPTGADDKLNPVGIAGWLPEGQKDSRGGFTGYSACYNDGNGTAFYPDGIPCSSTVNSRNASYYADHQGKLGDNLIDLIDNAIISTSFIPMTIVRDLGSKVDWGNLRMFTNKNVLRNLRQMARKNDDNLRVQLDKYRNFDVLAGAPVMYVEELDTPNAYLWGTDPLFALNMNNFFITCVKGWYFTLGNAVVDSLHTFTIPLDVMFAMGCRNRQQSGFKVSQHA